MKHISEYSEQLDHKIKKAIQKEYELNIPEDINLEFKHYLEYLKDKYFKCQEKITGIYETGSEDDLNSILAIDIIATNIKDFINNFKTMLFEIGIYGEYQQASPLKKIYDINNELIEVGFNESVYISSIVGSGKTTFLCSQAIKYLINNFSVKYINENEFFSRARGYRNKDRTQAIEILKNIRILIYDDLESYKPLNDYDYRQFRNDQYCIFDFRKSMNGVTLISSNYRISDLYKFKDREEDPNLYERIISRINKMCNRKIQFKNVDYRLKK